MYDGPMNWLRRTGIISLVAALVVLLGAAGALAASASDVADEVSQTGFHLEGNVSITTSDASAVVTAARNNGSRFYLIVLQDAPPGGDTTFAEAVLDDLNVDGGTVLVLSQDDVGWVTDNDVVTEADMDAAFSYANDQGGNDADYAAAFVVGLFGAQAPATTAASPATTAAASSSSAGSSGGGSGIVWFLVFIVGVGLLLFWLVRRGNKQSANAAAEQIAKARAAVQKQVDAIANDILDMEDEVRVADNQEVHQLYDQASETYRTLEDRLQQADTPQELVDISNDLDVAIWQLDCAEAVLDGKPKPPKPEQKILEPPAPAPGDRVTIPAPRPDYQRRPSRRSSYMGSGMMDILIGVAGQVLTGGSTGRGRGGLGSMGGLFGTSNRRNSPPRSGGGGGVIPGPGSPVRRSSPRSSARRSSGGRSRGGGRRRHR